MKKAFLIATFFVCIGNLVTAQTDTTGKQMYYYYPQQNVYFNQKSNNYIYYDSTSKGWQNVNLLPPYYSIDQQTPKDVIYYNGQDVWMDNTAHIKQFGTTPPPKTK